MNNTIDTNKLLENLPSGVVIHSMDTSIEFANKKALDLLGLSVDHILGRKAISKEWHLVDENGKALEVEEYPVNQVINTKQSLNGYILGIKTSFDANIIWVAVNAYLDTFDEKEKVVVTFSEISNTQNLLFKEIVDNARDAIIITKADPIDAPKGPMIVYVNDAFCKISGYTKEEAIGETPRILQKDDIDKKALENIKIALKNEEPIRETLLNYSKNDNPYWLDISIFPLHSYGNKVTHFAAIERDISQIKYSELAHLEASQKDALTTLLNRRGFDHLVEELFIQDSIDIYCIIAIDIDHFKMVNDTYGHEIGDDVLKRLSQVLKEISRKDDLVARFGGEEFILLLPHVNENQAINIAERIRKESESLNIKISNEEFIQFTISLGISSSSKYDELVNTISKADSALYQAKSMGRNQVKIYN